MSNELKNFAEGKDWWHMDRQQAIKLLETVCEAYNKKLESEMWFEEHDVQLKLWEIKNDIMKFPDLFFRNAGIKLESPEKSEKPGK